MTGKHWLTVLLLVAGVPIAAVGLARGDLLMALAGLVLLLVFIYLVIQVIVKAGKPRSRMSTSTVTGLLSIP